MPQEREAIASRGSGQKERRAVPAWMDRGGVRAIRRERRSAERPSECTSVACRSEHSAPNSRVRRIKTGDRCTAERHPAKLRQVEWQHFYSLPQEKEGIGPGEPGQKEGEREKRPPRNSCPRMRTRAAERFRPPSLFEVVVFRKDFVDNYLYTIVTAPCGRNRPFDRDGLRLVCRDMRGDEWTISSSGH